MQGFYSENYVNKEDFSIDSISHLVGTQPDQIDFANNDSRAVELILKRVKSSRILTIQHLKTCLELTDRVERTNALDKIFKTNDNNPK
jgi:hypothetical protein